MIKFFSQYEFYGLVIRDPITALSNLLLFVIGIWCFRKVAKFNNHSSEENRIGAKGWKRFFLFSAFAYLVGVPVHGFSFYIPVHIHFWIWISMGWIQMTGVMLVQLATAERYFPKQLSWIRVLVVLQFVFFCGLMVYIRRFGAVNTDVAVGLLPIAFLNIYLFKKKENASYLIGAGILFAALPAIFVGLKVMLAPWFSYNDIAHTLLIGSLLIICSGVVRCLEAGKY